MISVPDWDSLEDTVTHTNGKNKLVAQCHTHPRYMAVRKPRTKCESCWLLYVMRWQFNEKTDEKVGALNPFAYLIADVDLEDACSGIELKRVLSA